jgi:hypothetical protein
MALTMEELAKKIEALEKDVRLARDIQEIEQLQYQYVDSLFTLNSDELEKVFAEDVSFGSPDEKMPEGAPPMPEGEEAGHPPGPKELTQSLIEQAKSGNLDHTGGFVVHPTIKVDGDRATGHWVLYILLSYQLTNQILFYIQRTYDPVYVRENGKWKLSALNMSLNRLGPPMGGTDGAPPEPGASPYPGT